MTIHKLKAQLSWDDLRIILSVARAGSLSGAARELAVNHSTVLRRVSAFEAGLGVSLFSRQANAYLLTCAGEEMVAAAIRMEEELSASLLRISGMDDSATGVVKVTTVDVLAHYLLPSHLDAFHRAHPGITIELDVSGRSCDLGRGEADVAIRCMSMNTAPPDHLVGRRLSAMAFAAYAAGCRPDRDLAQHWWIGFDANVGGQPLAHWLDREVPASRIRMRSASVVTMFAAAKAGIGAALLPCVLGDSTPELTRLTPPIPELSGQVWLLTHPSLRRQGRVRTFLDFIANALTTERTRLEGREQPEVFAAQ